MARITSILESFTREAPKRPLREIAAAAGLPASTTRRLLVQLEEAGLVAQNPESHLYAPTAKLAHIGSLAMYNASLEEISRPALRRLSELSGEAAFLGALRGPVVTYLAQETAARDVVMIIRPGESRPALTTALGSVLLAHRIVAGLEVQEFARPEIDQAFADRFDSDVETMARLGCAVGIGGVSRESTSIAVPVHIPGHDLVSAIAISGPSFRFGVDQALAFLPQMVAEAEQIASTFPPDSPLMKESP
ncbi:IclR family transcriptional regulator [Aeromicrobium sp. CTD01-1L150]|uniref:IclR family transcriptional regulator n=1 Tax=Aeromicrobium sp. CTD01-1L150 TaxID=3341830 RepID=UPI0035C16248